jgi:hypothetical protein
MQNHQYKSGHPSVLDSTVNSEFNDNYDKYREIKTESFLGYLNGGKAYDLSSSVPSLPELPQEISHLGQSQNESAYMRETSESRINQPINTPSVAYHSPHNPASEFPTNALSNDYRRVPPATPFTPTQDTGALTPLIINPPTSLSRHSHLTIGSGPGDASDSDDYRFSGLSFGEQPLRSRVSSGPVFFTLVPRFI